MASDQGSLDSQEVAQIGSLFAGIRLSRSYRVRLVPHPTGGRDGTGTWNRPWAVWPRSGTMPDCRTLAEVLSASVLRGDFVHRRVHRDHLDPRRLNLPKFRIEI